MYSKIKKLYGQKLRATDGEIGQVKDFYFDDVTWAIRYVVVDTGSWLSGRQVLLSPHAFEPSALGRSDEIGHRLRVNLTRRQIEGSPSIETHRPVSRQYEAEYFQYYGWPAYWLDSALPGTTGFPPAIPPMPPQNLRPPTPPRQEDVHLCSTKAVTGYGIQAADGPLGKVSGFMFDARTWSIRELVVETGHWYAGKEILVLPKDVERISCAEAKVFVSLTQATLRQTTDHDVAQETLH